MTGIALIFVITTNGAAYLQNRQTKTTPSYQNRDIIWNATMNFNESGGAYDYAVFGEATDAYDGSPPDSYDIAKPPAPMPPYIRVWFNDSLPSPYDALWKDYRHYPGESKVWNLTVQWFPQGSSSPQIITASWNRDEVDDSEYTSVYLCTSIGVPLQNMLVNNSYNFSCPAYIPQTFTIICTANQPPNTPSSPSPTNQSTNVSIKDDLSWTGGDPDGDPVTYDVYFGISSNLSKITHNQSETTYYSGILEYQTTYYWKIVSWDNHKTSTVGPLWCFTTKPQPDITPPKVQITSPQKGFLYINYADNIHIKLPFLTTFVIGTIEVTVSAADNQSGVDKVEFYLDNMKKSTDTTEPYNWTWSERGSFSPHTLKVVAYDNAGNKMIDKLQVWKLF